MSRVYVRRANPDTTNLRPAPLRVRSARLAPMPPVRVLSLVPNVKTILTPLRVAQNAHFRPRDIVQQIVTLGVMAAMPLPNVAILRIVRVTVTVIIAHQTRQPDATGPQTNPIAYALRGIV